MRSRQPSPSSRLQVRPTRFSPLGFCSFSFSNCSLSLDLEFSIINRSHSSVCYRAVHAWDSHCPGVSGCEPRWYGRCCSSRQPPRLHGAHSHRRTQRPAGEQPQPSGQYALKLGRSWRGFRYKVKHLALFKISVTSGPGQLCLHLQVNQYFQHCN